MYKKFSKFVDIIFIEVNKSKECMEYIFLYNDIGLVCRILSDNGIVFKIFK